MRYPGRWPDSAPASPDFTGGQSVYGLLDSDRDGGAAEYVTAPAAGLAARPSSTDHVGAASLALAALTAWQALVRHAHLTAGQHVLVNGAAGGVGNYAVQLGALTRLARMADSGALHPAVGDRDQPQHRHHGGRREQASPPGRVINRARVRVSRR